MLFLCSVLFFWGSIQNIKAQAVKSGTTSDFESWVYAEVRLKLYERWTFELMEQVRLNKNSTQIDKYFTRLSVGYELLKYMEFKVAFRFSEQNKRERGYKPYYRTNVDIAFKHKAEHFSFNYRLRYQFKNRLGETDKKEENSLKHGLRFRAKAKYKSQKIPLEPSFAVEMFYQYEKRSLSMTYKLQFTVALAYDLKKYGKIELFHHLEQNLFSSSPKTVGIIGLGYIYTISKLKK